MTTTEQRLANALRDLLRCSTMTTEWGGTALNCGQRRLTDATEALAAYDAQQARPGGLTLATLKRSAIKSPFEAGAREEVVTHAGNTYHVARGHESKGGWYYTVRGPSWQGYRIADSIEHVKSIIRGNDNA